MNATLDSLATVVPSLASPAGEPRPAAPAPAASPRQSLVLAGAAPAACAEADPALPVEGVASRAENLAAVADMNASATGIRFLHADGEDDTQIQIIDQSTDEVIQEFPSTQMLKVMNRIEEVIGRLFDHQA